MSQASGVLEGRAPAALLEPARQQKRERRDWASRDRIIRRVRSEFFEMPGLRLTFAQARLLFDLESGCCQRVLCELTRSGFLVRTGPGLYGRRDLIR